MAACPLLLLLQLWPSLRNILPPCPPRRSNGATRPPAMSPGQPDRHLTHGSCSGATMARGRCPPHPSSGQFLPTSSLSQIYNIWIIPQVMWLRQKLGEEGSGQDLQASCLSMKIGGMFQEVIAMSVPVLNQSNPAPFQAIIGTTSKDILLTAKPGAISFSQDLQVNWLICILFEVLSDCLLCHLSTLF
uniref:Xylanase inhibitor C-terminal domain-containing protein n=1 Tax=Oryza punctata TaxID=4537 RepID=A0A0E0M6B3_ORYPU